MSSLAVSLAPPRSRVGLRLAYEALCALTGSVLVAGLAQISFRVPWTPVPYTGQTLGVLLVGASLGPSIGAASLGLYLLEGAVGLPFFAGGASGWDLLRLSAVTGGYLWGFLIAAAVVGALARLGWDRSIRSAIGAFFIGEVVLYLIGVPWLMGALHVGIAKGLEYGLYPFVLGDTVKLLLAAGTLPAAWRILNALSPERGN